MFLHIGGSRVVAAQDIVGIFTIDIHDRQCNKEFLQSARRLNESNGLSKEEIKAFIVTTKGVSFSPIAPATLKKRFQENNFNK
ncbi:MAG: DUF370 domain-containing protein [Firmicutes bacterium]|nr:DUF370 domain-containing protein [Bacillota bacterium]